MDGLSTGNGFDHSFQRQGGGGGDGGGCGGCSGGRQQLQGGPWNLTGVETESDFSFHRARFLFRQILCLEDTSFPLLWPMVRISHNI